MSAALDGYRSNPKSDLLLQRFQLKRSRGWRMPANTLKVYRSTRWGNHPAARAGATGAEAVEIFAQWVRREAPEEWRRAAMAALTGKHLACWCKVGAPCHADFLLEWLRTGGNCGKASTEPVRRQSAAAWSA